MNCFHARNHAHTCHHVHILLYTILLLCLLQIVVHMCFYTFTIACMYSLHARSCIHCMFSVHASKNICASSTTTMCKTRPAGRVRPATRFCPAREMFLNYNGNRPAACHRPPLHYTIEGLRCLPRHHLKINVITTFIFFDNALLNAQWIVWILISTDISVDRSFHLWSDARW